MYLRLVHGTTQIAPARPGQWWRPDRFPVEIRPDYPIPQGETSFYLEGAAPAANFDHTFDFEMQIEVPEGVDETGLLSSWRDWLTGVLE